MEKEGYAHRGSHKRCIEKTSLHHEQHTESNTFGTARLDVPSPPAIVDIVSIIISILWEGPATRNCTGDKRSRGHCGTPHGKASVSDTWKPGNLVHRGQTPSSSQRAIASRACMNTSHPAFPISTAKGNAGFFCLPWRALSWQQVTEDVATALPGCPETPLHLSHASYCPHQASRRDAGKWYGSGGAAPAH
jgi:hypothetical protein